MNGYINKCIYKLSLSISIVIIVGCCYIFDSYAQDQGQFQQVPALIHISSKVSDGRYTLSELVNISKEAGIKAVVFTDREIMRWEYGLWPLRNVIKKVVENSSITTFGIGNYLRAVEKLQESNSDMILIAAIEATPFYYWSGNIFKGYFTLHNAHKHLLIIGLEKLADFKNLPVVGYRFNLYQAFTFKDILKLWPFVVVFLGIFLVATARKRIYKNILERQAAQRKYFYGVFCIIIGLLFLINNFPFREPLFDQYHGDQGSWPYQNVINYVNENQGLVFWAHPETGNYSKTKHVEVVTEEHTQDFYDTQNYTGFCIFYEGYEKIGKTGGLWDKVLLEYVQGKRENPVWAIGGLAFDYHGDLRKKLEDLRNILLLKSYNKDEVINALRDGRMYVLRGCDSSNFILDDFSVQAGRSKEVGIMGQTLKLTDNTSILRIAGHFKNKQKAKNRNVVVRLIKNGKIIQVFNREGDFDIRFTDNGANNNMKAYYRIEIKGKNIHLVSNPIFVK